MKRIADLLTAVIALTLLIIPILVVAISVKISSIGPVLYWSNRVGQNNNIFRMPKFRSMKIDTPVVATHLLVDAKNKLTPIGDVLRKTSLDEIPQIWNIIRGDMSFVGPRPALYNQHDLISLRTEHCVHKLLPGLTGWAQINGRDDIGIQEKVSFDVEYMKRQSFSFDLMILWLTFIKVIKHENVSH